MPEVSKEARRVWASAGILLCATLLLHSVSHGEPKVPRLPLRQIPLTIAGWQGRDDELEPAVVHELGVTEYVNRIYRNQSLPPTYLYVGFYESQRTGDNIHSPKNCIPGSGWEPVKSSRLSIDTGAGTPVVVNNYLIEKGLDQELVLYWYQSQGRVIASEYRAKFWLAVGAMTRNRTDGALVRLVTSAEDGEDKAQARLIGFMQAIYPELGRSIPD